MSYSSNVRAGAPGGRQFVTASSPCPPPRTPALQRPHGGLWASGSGRLERRTELLVSPWGLHRGLWISGRKAQNKPLRVAEVPRFPVTRARLSACAVPLCEAFLGRHRLPASPIPSEVCRRLFCRADSESSIRPSQRCWGAYCYLRGFGGRTKP